MVASRASQRLKAKRFVGAVDGEDKEVLVAAGGERDVVDFSRSSFFFRETASALVLPDNEPLSELFGSRPKVELIVNIEKIREIRLSGKQLEHLKALLLDAERLYADTHPQKKKHVSVSASVKAGSLGGLPAAVAKLFFTRFKQLASNSNAFHSEDVPNGVEGIGAILAILVEARCLYINHFALSKELAVSGKQLAWLLPIIDKLNDMVSELLYAAAQTFNKSKASSADLSVEVEAVVAMLDERLDPDRSVTPWTAKELAKLFDLSLEFRQLHKEMCKIRKQGLSNDAVLFLLVAHFNQQLLMKLMLAEHKELRSKFFPLLHTLASAARAGYWAVLKEHHQIDLRESDKWDLRDSIFDISEKLLWGRSPTAAAETRTVEGGPPALLSELIKGSASPAAASASAPTDAPLLSSASSSTSTSTSRAKKPDFAIA